MSMLLHCGSEEVTRAQVEAVPVPRRTQSWAPVAYGRAIELLHKLADRHLGMPVRKEQYGLNKAGDQMFGLLTLDAGNDESGLSIGLRQSYNKTLALGVAVGAQVFVCDNLVFSGNAFKVVRKNTTNVWADFLALLTAQVRNAELNYRAVQADTLAMKAAPVSLDRGYEHLGRAIGEGVLTPTQATVAFGDWKTPRHAEFADRNVWGLYNAVTEGLKKGAPARILDRHAKAHDFFGGLISQSA